MRNDGMTWEGLLSEMERSGWQPGMESSPAAQNASGREAAEEVAKALLSYWRDDPTLANYAHLLNGSSVLFSRNEDKTALMNALNQGYIAARQNHPPNTAAQTYEELRFWRGLDSREGLAYYARLSDHFAAQVAAQGQVGPELGELLQSRDLDPQMRDLRRQAVEALRKQLPARLNQERSPVKRLRHLMDIMTGVGGVRLVDEGLWQQSRAWVLPAAQVSGDNYIALRNILTGTLDGEFLDHPREALTRIESLLESMDESVDYGSGMEASTMLTYWRGQGFDGLPDDALLRLYQNYLQGNPQGRPLLSKDLPLVEGRNNAQINALLQPARTDPDRGEGGRGGKRGRDRSSSAADNGRYAPTPVDGRERRASGGLSSKAKGGIVALCLLIVVLIVLILSDPNSGEKIRKDQEQRKETPATVSTPEREERTEEPPEESQEAAPSPNESPEDTPKTTAPPEDEPEEEIEVEGADVSEEESLQEASEENLPYEEPEGGEVAPSDDEASPPEAGLDEEAAE